MVGQQGFWDEAERLAKLTRKKSSLERLKAAIPWEELCPLLESLCERAQEPGRSQKDRRDRHVQNRDSLELKIFHNLCSSRDADQGPCHRIPHCCGRNEDSSASHPPVKARPAQTALSPSGHCSNLQRHSSLVEQAPLFPPCSWI